MSSEFVRFGFSSGEISPHLYGHSDLEKYDQGLALAYNWYIDYRGGVSTRPGTEFGDFIKHPELPSRFFQFVFSPDIADTYILLFGDESVRFIQNNAYVLEDGKNVTGITQALPGVVTSVAHGYGNGDWLYINAVVGMTGINGKLVVVANRTANTFELRDYFGDFIDTAPFGAYVSGGIARRVYTLDSIYTSDELADLRAEQVRDTIRLTHPQHPPYDLIRNDHTDWVLSPTVIGNEVPAPTNVQAFASDVASSPPGTSTAYVVTAVDHDGNESVGSDFAFLDDAKNILFMDASNNVTYWVTWDVVSDAAYYNVYRTIYRIHATNKTGRSAEVGYIGRAYGTIFYDQNIIPDFTKTPPQNHNPFVNRAVKWINVTAGGAGYSNATAITITTATGVGFVGYPVIQISGGTTGPLVAILIVDGGHDYAPGDTVNATVGAGATFELNLSEPSGNYPRLSTIFQQRQIYAATLNEPMTVFGSKPGKFKNFDVSSIVLPDDEYEHDIDSSIMAPLRHIIPLRGGLLCMSTVGNWVLSGEGGVALTPKNPQAEPQSFGGSSKTRPVRVGSDLLYIESHGYTARLLTYKDFNKVYTSDDISYLSSHLFGPGKRIENFAYAATPNKVVWGQRQDGSLLSFTTMSEQKVYAWAQHWTQGTYQDCIAVGELNQDSVYLMVDREFSGRAVKMFERMVQRVPEFSEDAWCVDCGLSLPTNKPPGELKLNAASGTNVGAISSVGVFAGSDVGKIIRIAGAKALVTAYISDFRVNVNILRPATELLPFTDIPVPALEGEWTLDRTVNSVSGLSHLEGQTVVYLADGNVGETVVAGGEIRGLGGVTRVVVGLKFVCDAKTLPLSEQGRPVEGKKKRIVRCAVNQLQSRGLKVGTSFDKMYDIKDRKNEFMGEPIELQEGTSSYQPLSQAHWEIGAAVCIRQDQPLPATLRALVLDVEIGG